MSEAAGKKAYNAPVTAAPKNPVPPSTSNIPVAAAAATAPPPAPVASAGESNVWNQVSGKWDRVVNQGLNGMPVGAAQPSAPPSTYSQVPGATPQLPAGASQYEREIYDVMKMNGISLEEAKKRHARAKAFEAGQVASPGAAVDPATGQPYTSQRMGVVYDPASGTYKDPLTNNFYGGWDPTKGNIFTADQKAAITTMFASPNKGVITSEDTDLAAEMIGAGITSALENPLPHANSKSGVSSFDQTNGAGEGEEWTTQYPPEVQEILDSIKAQATSLQDTNDEMSKLLDDQKTRSEARYKANVGDIHAQAEQQIEDQKIANKQAEAMVKTRMASLGATGSTQEMQYLRDTISGGERALRDIANSERKAVNEATMAFEDNDLELAFKKLEFAESRRKEYTDLLMKQQEVKTTFENQLMQKMQFKKQMRQLDLQERELNQKSALESAKMMIESGAKPEDIPDETYQALSAENGVSVSQMKAMMYTAQKSVNIQNAKDMADVYKSAVDIAAGLPIGETMNLPLPDGGSLAITGQMSMSGKTETFTATLGTNKYGPPGQYILAKDTQGNVVNAQYIGEHYVAPQINPETGRWTVYDPNTDTETEVFNSGQYGEGDAALGTATSYVNGLTAQGFRVTQEPGEGFSHKNLTGWDVAMPDGTEVMTPQINGKVVGVHKYNGNLKRSSGSNNDYGNYVDVQDIDTGAIYRFGHLSEIGVEMGQIVDPSMSVGLSGNTGFSTGNHLHVEMRTADNHAVTPNRNAPKQDESAEPSLYAQYLEANPGKKWQYGVDKEGVPVGKTDRANAEAWYAKEQEKRLKETEKKTRPLESGQSNTLAGGRNLTEGPLLTELEDLINNNEKLFGPVRGVWESNNPLAEGATVQDNFKRATQIIGSYLEGGVLRAEDEIKYRKMLPQLTDTPEVARDKLEGIRELLTAKHNSYINAYRDSGFDVGAYVKPKENPPAGSIWVQDREGNVGSIPLTEFDSSIYTKL